MEYKGVLLSMDSYMNLQLANAEEFIDGAHSGNLGEILIRCNNVLYIRGGDEPVKEEVVDLPDAPPAEKQESEAQEQPAEE
eukprot:m.10812 g.10812  ORF g.10812 m.10812 type:complete len:81 (+) comp7493_c0_seq1:247-489(+)